MIKSLCITNFRSYKKAFLEFSPGVNVIIGENDAGKTNIIRAIDLVVNNRPSGDDYISTSGGDLQADLEVDDKIVTRSRSAKWNKKQDKFVTGEINIYELSGEKTPFKSFGMNVPDLIKQHLNISPVSIAFQLEGPFLLNKSAADVAKHYNNIVNLDVIDTTISNIASTLRSERSTLKVEEANEKELIGKLEKYDWLEEAEISLVKLEQTQALTTRLETDKFTLSRLIKEHEELETTRQELSNIIQHDKTVIDLIKVLQTIRALAKDRFALQELIDKNEKLAETSHRLSLIVGREDAVNLLITQKRTITELQAKANVLKASIFQIEQLRDKEKIYHSIAIHEKCVDRLIKTNKKITLLTKDRDGLRDNINQHKKLSEAYSQFDKTIEWLEKEFKEVMPELCPIFDVQCDYIDKVKR